jgi:hypothetical protein
MFKFKKRCMLSTHLIGESTYCFSCSNTEPTITLPKKTLTTITTKYFVAAFLSIFDKETRPSNLERNIISWGRNVSDNFSERPGKKPCRTDLINLL